MSFNLTSHLNNQKVSATCVQNFEAIRQSDERAIMAIYREYLPLVKNYIRRRKGNEEEARDIFQQALMIIYKNVQSPDFTFRKSFGAYLMTVCRNLWSKELRKMNRITNELPLDVFEIETGDLERIDDYLEEQEKVQLFDKIFNTLPQEAQKVLTLYFEGKKMREIAEIMGYASEGYAKKRKCVFQKKLIAMIQENGAFGELVC